MKMILQHDQRDCGAACLAMIARHYGYDRPLSFFREITKTDRNGTNLYGLIDAAGKIALKADALQGTPEELFSGIHSGEIRFPFIAHIRNEQDMLHFVVVSGMRGNCLILGDPGKGKRKMAMDEFCQRFTGYIVVFERTKDFVPMKDNPGSLRRFLPLLRGQCRRLLGVLAISLLVSVIGIYSSFVFQIVIDDFYADRTSVVTSGGTVHDHDLPEAEEDGHAHDGELEYAAQEHSESEHELEEVYWLDSLGVTQRFGDTVMWLAEQITGGSFHLVFIILIALYLLQAVMDFIRGLLIAWVSRDIDVGITLSYYNHLVSLPVSSVSTRLTGEYLSRFSDTYTIRNAISMATLTLILDTVMFLSCGLMLWFQNRTLFGVSLVMVALYAFILVIYRRPVERCNRTMMEHSAAAEAYFKETIDGIETVKAANAEEMIREKASGRFCTFIHSAFKSGLVSLSQDVLCTAIELVGTAVILWMGFSMVMEGYVTIGQMMAFYSLLSLFTEPIKNLVGLQPTIQTALVAADRLSDVLDLRAETKKTSGEMLAPVREWRFDHVDFRYANHELTLRNISLSIARGEKIAIVGESGSGKTTLARLLLRFYEPESGQIFADDRDIALLDLESLRRSIAYVDQHTFMFADTLRNNLILGCPEATEEDIWAACQACRIDGFIRSLPLGLDTPLDENGMNLSGGQRQRLSIARALLKKPQLLILDEATSNLDTITETGIKQAVFDFDPEMTCIIIAHRLTTIRQCDRIIVMQEGSICEMGTHESLLAHSGVYARLWDTQ